MFIVFMLIVVIGAAVIFNTLESGAKFVPKKSCYEAAYGEPKTHTWVQKPIPDEKGYLICSVCDREPGDG